MVRVADEKVTAKAKIEYIDPRKAEIYLENNRCGRPFRRAEAERRCRDMLEGRWQFSADTIKFARPDQDGVELMIDGQHRMGGVVMAGIRLPFLVVRGLEPEARDVVDIGLARTPGDTFNMEGLSFGTVIAAVAKLILTNGGETHYRPTKPELLQVVRSDENVVWAVETSLSKHPELKRLMTSSVQAYVFWRLNRIDSEACVAFFEALDGLANLDPTSPILALHKRLAGHDRRGNAMNNRRIPLSYIYQGWNAWRRGDERALIRVTRNRNGELIVPEPI